VRFIKKYPILTVATISIVFIFMFAESEVAYSAYRFFGSLGHWGSFLCGILFAFSATAFASLAILYHLSSYIDPLQIALIGGLGSMFADYLLLKSFKGGAFHEMQSLWKSLTGRKNPSFISSKIYRKISPLLGFLVIASPLPDELGVAILGSSKLTPIQFVATTYLLNSIGIYLIALVGK